MKTFLYYLSTNRGSGSKIWVGKNGSDYPSDISRGDCRSLAPPERQFDTASAADVRTGEGEEEAFHEDRRPDGDDR
jgi:hypothetical protein